VRPTVLHPFDRSGQTCWPVMVPAESGPGGQAGRGRGRLAGWPPETRGDGTRPVEERRACFKKQFNINKLTKDPATRQPAAGPSSPASGWQREAGDRSWPDGGTTEPKSSGAMVRTTSPSRRTGRSGPKNSEKRKRWWVQASRAARSACTRQRAHQVRRPRRDNKARQRGAVGPRVWRGVQTE
jgi:hypothetical protein